MSAPNLPKRRIVDEVKAEVFEEKVNALPDYMMEHFAVSEGYDGPEYSQDSRFVAVMKLKSEGDTNLQSLLDVMDVPISKAEENRPFGSPLVAKALAEGWTGGALYSGKITMFRKKKDEPTRFLANMIGGVSKMNREISIELSDNSHIVGTEASFTKRELEEIDKFYMGVKKEEK